MVFTVLNMSRLFALCFFSSPPGVWRRWYRWPWVAWCLCWNTCCTTCTTPQPPSWSRCSGTCSLCTPCPRAAANPPPCPPPHTTSTAGRWRTTSARAFSLLTPLKVGWCAQCFFYLCHSTLSRHFGRWVGAHRVCSSSTTAPCLDTSKEGLLY